MGNGTECKCWIHAANFSVVLFYIAYISKVSASKLLRCKMSQMILPGGAAGAAASARVAGCRERHGSRCQPWLGPKSNNLHVFHAVSAGSNAFRCVWCAVERRRMDQVRSAARALVVAENFRVYFRVMVSVLVEDALFVQLYFALGCND